MKLENFVTGSILLGLSALTVYLWVWKTPDFDSKNPDEVWCEENGGRWIDSFRNMHCEWVPDYINNN